LAILTGWFRTQRFSFASGHDCVKERKKVFMSSLPDGWAAMSNKEKFRVAYTAALTYQHGKHPEKYAFPAEELPIVVEAYARGSGNPGPAVKAAAKALGIPPTLKAVREFLQA
jgi:hypothetical protein